LYMSSHSEAFISGSSFFNNSARGGGSGGALLAHGASLTVSAASFHSNSVWEGHGGASALLNCIVAFNSAHLSNNTASSVSAEAVGGALYVNGGNVLAKDVILEANEARNGGAMFVTN